MKTKIYLAFLMLFASLIGWAQNESMSIDPSLSVISIVEKGDVGQSDLFGVLDQQNFNFPPNTYRNPVKKKSYFSDAAITDASVIGFLQTNRTGNDILAGILNENNKRVDASKLIARAENELTLEQLEMLKRRGTDTKSLFKEYIRLANNSYLLVYAFDRLEEFDVVDTTYNERRKEYSISRKRGYTAYLNTFLVKPDYSEFTLNQEFFANGWTRDDREYSDSELEERSRYRNETMEIQWKVESQEGEKLRSIFISDTKKIKADSLSEESNAVLKRSSDKAINYPHNKTDRNFNLRNTYVPQAAVMAFAGAPQSGDFRDLLPATPENVRRAFITEIVPKKNTSKKARGIRGNIGKAQGLRTNHRYQVRRNVKNPKTGVEKSKLIGTVLAHHYLTANARGEQNLGNTSRFKQIYGFRIRQFDQILEDRVLGTLHGGFGSTGVNLMMDFTLQTKLGSKFYVEYGFDRRGQRPTDLPGDIQIDGESFTTEMNVHHLGIGLSKEYYVNRFYVGWLFGLTAYNASFVKSEVRDLIVGEDESFYTWDWSWELGFRGGLRITKDIGAAISATVVDIDFSEQELPRGGFLNLEGYSQNVYLSVFYDIPFSGRQKKQAEKQAKKSFNNLINKF